MSFDRAALAATIAAHGPVVRVVICAHQGSSPREAGAAMLVWADGQSGTIGGGALEYQATQDARELLSETAARVEKIALGPNLGQCCGGAVVLAFERFTDVEAVPQTGLYARPVTRDAATEPPLAVRQAQKSARGQGVASLRYAQGWLAEPVQPPRHDLWIWGAGHVGRAMVATLSPLPDVAITWVDTGADRFPTPLPTGVTRHLAPNPADLVPLAPARAEHLILTFSHALDLDLCHRLLNHGFTTCGLIGSATKWSRFRSRLQALGHTPAQISRISCPIGDPSFGKHPQAIAISVAAAVLSRHVTTLPREIAQ